MKKFALPVVLAVLAVSVIGVAKADPVAGASTTAVSQPWTVKIGVAIPTSSDVKDAVGSTWIAAGVDYAFEKSGAVANPTLPSIYLDYTGTSKDGINISKTGLGVAVRTYTNSANTTSTVKPYVGIGIGAYDITATGASSKVEFGGKVFGGIEFASNWLAEVNYNYVSKDEGTDPSSYGIEVGYRF